tara:strand:+ start:195124 stop:195471 length:348 start_codon:yes stop_codon:yes gene_type:complete
MTDVTAKDYIQLSPETLATLDEHMKRLYANKAQFGQVYLELTDAKEQWARVLNEYEQALTDARREVKKAQATLSNYGQGLADAHGLNLKEGSWVLSLEEGAFIRKDSGEHETTGT